MNRNVHVPVGAVAAFADRALAVDPHPLLGPEIVGRLIGGVLGGRLPDVVDPPTHPGHRGIGHAVLPALAVLVVLLRAMPGVQAALRQHARTVRRVAASCPVNDRWPLQLEAIATEFLLGLIVGTPAGYASHLVLDATTPAGLPWLARGFS